LQGLELSRESLLIPSIVVEAGSRGKGCQRWSGAWRTPGASPLPRRPSDKGVWGGGVGPVQLTTDEAGRVAQATYETSSSTDGDNWASDRPSPGHHQAEGKQGSRRVRPLACPGPWPPPELVPLLPWRFPPRLPRREEPPGEGPGVPWCCGGGGGRRAGEPRWREACRRWSWRGGRWRERPWLRRVPQSEARHEPVGRLAEDWCGGGGARWPRSAR
jgi:hypothetical protein